MSWSSIADKSTAWVDKSFTNEVVPDPGFDDATAWTIAGFGGTVTNSQLRYINATSPSSATVPVITPVVGRSYKYKIVVGTYTGGALYRRIRFAGVDIYNTEGAGTFEGTINAVTADGLILLTIMTGQWFIDSISIMEGWDADADAATTWSNASISTTWANVAANTTTWS